MTDALVEDDGVASDDPGPSSYGVAPRRWRRVAGWGPIVLVPLGFVALSLWMYARLVAHLDQRLVGGPDGVAFAWYFEWVEQSIVHLHNPFVSTGLNAPSGFNLMWNTSVLAPAVICAPLTAILGPFTTVGIVFALSPAVSATAAYMALRRLTGSWVGAALGALLYGFGPFFGGHYGHLNLIFAPFPPLAVLLGYRLLVDGTGNHRRVGTLLGVLVGVQLLVSEEIVALFAIGAVIALFWLAVLHRHQVRSRWRPASTGMGVAIGVALLIAGIPLAYQILGPHALTHGVTAGGARADLTSYVRPSLLERYSTSTSVAANSRFPANGAENTAYLGWPLIIAIGLACAWGLWRRIRFVAWWLLTAGSIAVLSLGTPISVNGHMVGHGPWALVSRVPLLGGAQPVRLSLLTALMVAGLIAWLVAQQRGGWRVVAATATSGLVLLPLWPAHLHQADSIPTTPAFFTSRGVDEIPSGATTVVLPQAEFPHVDAMVFQIRSHLRFDLVGGYSVFTIDGRSNSSPPLPAFEEVLEDAARRGALPEPARLEAVRGSVDASGVRYLLITPEVPHAAAVARTAAALTGCAPRIISGVIVCAVQHA
jgi:hypothetical protein